MSNGQAAVRNAAISSLKFKKHTSKDHPSSSSPSTSSSTPSSQRAQPSPYNVPPAQSRDASVPSRYFPTASVSASHVLVPSSSPPPADVAHHSHISVFDSGMPDVIPGLVSDPWRHPSNTQLHDSLSASSGFTDSRGGSSASHTRPWEGNAVYTPPVQDSYRGEPPRKRINRGSTPGSDPIDLFALPDSPKLQRPLQRRQVHSRVVSSASEEESVSETKDSTAGPSQPRIHRPSLSDRHATPASDVSNVDHERFTKFKMIHPEHPVARIQAAWQQAGGDELKANALLDNPSWSPPSTKSPLIPRPKLPTETGRVKEVEEAKEAERARLRNLGKNSLIHKNRVFESRPTVSTSTPPTSRTKDFLKTSPQTPESPDVIAKRPKRLKRKIISSDSEPEVDDSDDGPLRQVFGGRSPEQKALNFFNTGTAEALREVTGCTAEQANKIVELRPFGSIDDLKTRLAQGRKKAGPAGISSRIFEDCASIFEGYGKVDNILEECEDIGNELRNEIASWTGSSTAKKTGPSSSRGSPLGSDVMEEGAVSLRSQAILAKKPKYYISTQPSLLNKDVQLKDYQMLGINWLNLLYQKKLSCILADEMGLGKTVQVISFFAHLRERGRKGPHLIVVPASTLENWLREFNRFAPDLQVEPYYGSKEDRMRTRELLRRNSAHQVEGGWEVLVTTYSIAQGDERDRKFFRHIDWDTCIFDEGHVLKNFQSQRYQALLKFQSRWRLLLTGTPLQNNLQELVSLMNFILPQKFEGELDAVRAVFKTKGDTKVTLLAQERVSRAKKLLTPFVLRRRKDQVLQDLPKKTERIEWCDMTSLQKSIYNDALRRSRKTIFDEESPQVTDAAESSKKPAKKKTRTTARTKDKMYVENSANVLMDLRKAALHPMLFRRRFTDSVLSSITKLLLKEPDYRERKAEFKFVKEDMSVMTDAELQAFCETYKSTRKYLLPEDCYMQAGKVRVLFKLLRHYDKQGRRVLVFSQFTQVLDILQKVLDREKMKYLLLTGSTPVDARQSLVDQFSEDESIPVFLLSTKAGGMGINLTAASVVIMFDQDFNPHNDKQAQDRAYRIGQKRDVEVIKLVTKGSIEEDMLQLGLTKLALDEAVAGESDEKIESEVKTSLLNVVRKKLETFKEDGESEKDDRSETEEKEGMDSETVKQPMEKTNDVSVDMDIDDESSLSELE